MSLNETPAEPPPPPRSCDRCGAPCDDECAVWNNVVCVACFEAWSVDAPDAGAVAAQQGGWDRPFSEFYEPFTRAWCASGAAR